MVMLTCFSLIVGAALGLRLTFLILVPTIGCILVIVAGFGVATGLGIRSTGLMMVLTASGLQLGYLAGAAIQVVAARLLLFRQRMRLGSATMSCEPQSLKSPEPPWLTPSHDLYDFSGNSVSIEPNRN